MLILYRKGQIYDKYPLSVFGFISLENNFRIKYCKILFGEVLCYEEKGLGLCSRKRH